MRFVSGFVRRPQPVWLRRAMFQIHLWAGILLTLYLIVISVTGAILVFREELEALAGANPWSDIHWGEIQRAGTQVDAITVLEKLRMRFPDARVTSLSIPSDTSPIYLATVQSRGKTLGSSKLAIHPVTGEILGRTSRRLPPNWAWLATIRNLHVTLLSGVTGRKVNGVLAGCLLIINLSGMVVWWSGLQIWTRGLSVKFAMRWRRLNFDLHSAVGFWTLALVSFWGVSGLYFGFSSQVLALVEKISPVISARPPTVRVEPQATGTPADLRAILSDAVRQDPRAAIREIVFPANKTAPLEISMQRAGTRGAQFSDTLYFDPYDGHYLTIWQYGVNQSLGDWFIWSQIPLHFGTFWGLGVKVLWAMVSLGITLLCVTGVIMSWNRFGRRVRRIQAPNHPN